MIKKIMYLPYVVKWNIKEINYILTHPNYMGSGTKEQWKEKKRVLEELLRHPHIVEVEAKRMEMKNKRVLEVATQMHNLFRVYNWQWTTREPAFIPMVRDIYAEIIRDMQTLQSAEPGASISSGHIIVSKGIEDNFKVGIDFPWCHLRDGGKIE